MKNPIQSKGASMRNALIGGAVIMAVAFSAFSQVEKTLEFIPSSVDFGTIRETDGKITKYVKAVNITADTTFIISARTSCGCSGADYPKELIAPGDTVEVSVTYNPLNRPGRFLKTAKFFTGDQRISNPIKLCGMVIPSKENLDREYPVKVGNLRVSSLLINAGGMSRTETRPFFVGVYNDSVSPVKLIALTDAKALEATLTPDSIGPFGVSAATLMLKGRDFDDSASEFLYKSYILDAVTGDTLLCVPIAGMIKTPETLNSYEKGSEEKIDGLIN